MGLRAQYTGHTQPHNTTKLSLLSHSRPCRRPFRPLVTKLYEKCGLEKLRNEMMYNKAYYILDIDIQKCFDTISHVELRKFLDLRRSAKII